ncbi:MAG: DedA family protein [Abditibacteriales bacterium]|nr:DedA family protein [Abditibacteriales bacterium]MDW8364605.1 DedA family protein [Abditibacteriales bacterium]
MHELLDFILRFDHHLGKFIRDYGTWTYLILFLIIFCETGLVVTPFLPGDSLLFAAGAFAARGDLGVMWLFILLSIAAIAGDTVNYWIGARVGPRAFTGKVRFLKKEHLDRTHAFYEKYGGKTIVLARFVPIVRTFAPFVAGVGSMTYSKFLSYNVFGGLAWIAIFVFGGYQFGNIPYVQKNFKVVILAIILISVLPMVIEYLRARAEAKKSLSPSGAER